MATVSITTTTAVGQLHPLAASELAHACGADTAWVVQLVEVGIVRIETEEAQPERWRFSSADLQHALEARRLERDFGIGLDARGADPRPAARGAQAQGGAADARPAIGPRAARKSRAAA